MNIEAAVGGGKSSPVFCKNGSECREILLQNTYWHHFVAMTTLMSLIVTLIMTNFHFHLIQLWWQFFQMFVYGDVVYAQTWEVLTLKNCIAPPQHASTAYVFALYACLFFLTVS